MKNLKKQTVAAGVLLLSIGVMTYITAQSGSAPPPTETEWRSYAADSFSTKYSPLDQITASNVGLLRVAWRWKSNNFGPRNEGNMETTPLMVGGKLYFTAGQRRVVIAADAETGETLWMYRLEEGDRANLFPRPYNRGVAYWKDTNGEERIYAVTAGYNLVALDAKTGIPALSFGVKGIVDLYDGLERVKPGEIGSTSPPIIVKDVIIVGAALKNGTSPTSKTNVPGDAVMAFNMDSGKVLWTMQALARDVWHNGCVQNVPGRGGRGRGAAAPQPPPTAPGRGPGGALRGNAYPSENCPPPDLLGPDWDFGAPPALAQMSDGRDILIAPQKQGLIWALNPDTGQVIWKQDVAREIDGGRGETLFGGAVDSERAYFGLTSSGHVALDLRTGEELWWAPATPPAGRQNQRGIVGAVTLIPGALLSGARDGMLRAVSSRTGQLLWEFDTAREFTTVNGVAAKGGSGAPGGPIVANGMVFFGSGYPGFQNGQPGNVLLAFAPAVRLDVFADERK